MSNLLRSQYWKSIVPLLATIVALFLPLLTGDHSGLEWINVAILAGGTIVAYTAANLSTGIARWTKEIVGVVTAGLVVLQSVYADGITRDEWKQIGVAVVMAIIVLAKGNDGYVPPDETTVRTVA
jgi:hypothetical protein